MAINPVEFDTATVDKVTGKPTKQASAWGNKQFWWLMAAAGALVIYVVVRIFL